MNLNDIKKYFAMSESYAKKGFSQNFLINSHSLQKIISHVPEKKGFYLEIGGGLGSLTSFAVEKKLFPLTVVDLDEKMVQFLKEKFNDVAEIFVFDGAKIDCSKLFKGEKGFVFGNLPYNASTDILINICLNSPYLDGALFLLQKETAEKFCAKAGEKNFGTIAALIQFTGSSETLHSFPPEDFYPPPKVHSTLLKISFNGEKKSFDELKMFASFIKVLFSSRRKTLSNVFKINNFDLQILEMLNISTKKRAEELSWETVLAIWQNFKKREK
ncbi:MAG: 16S rRNA (adenine(1518)-N(6)/adenine(1519)-N(6))-dimethyltransferase RsmA [bacterium]